MIQLKITCDTGNTWTTGFNGTLAAATDYFVGKGFVREAHDGTEITDTVISVVLISCKGVTK